MGSPKAAAAAANMGGGAKVATIDASKTCLSFPFDSTRPLHTERPGNSSTELGLAHGLRGEA